MMMRKLIGIVLMVAGVAAGIYVGFWILFVGGIVDVVDGAKATPTNGGMIAWGLAKSVLLAEIVGGAIFFVVSGIGAAIFGSSKMRG